MSLRRRVARSSRRSSLAALGALRSSPACVRRRSDCRGQGPRRRPVYTAEIDGIIHPVAAEYVRETIARADAAGAALVVFTLRTPGGLVDSTRDINNAIIAREDAGRRVRRPVRQPRRLGRLPDHHAADVAAMAPGHPHRRRPSGRGQRREGRRHDGQEDGLGRRRLRADARDAARSATWRWSSRRSPKAGPTPSRRRSAAAPPLIDLIAADVPDLIRKLDGRTRDALRRPHGDPPHRRRIDARSSR